MRKKYYIFNPDTQAYEPVAPNPGQRFFTSLRRALLFIALGAGTFLLFHFFIDKPSVEELENENSQILAQYKILSKRLDEAILVLQDIQQRDDNLYRVMLDAEPISAEVRNAGYGGTNRYDELLKMDNSELLVETTQKIDLLEKQLYMQIKSFDEIVALDQDSKIRLRHIPAIQPIANRDLKRTASGYGYRIDPVYNVRTFHKGMDFSCDKKTPIYATADGIVESAKWMSGYGYTVVIDHGYGYKTLYAHLLDKKFLVKKGQQVVRGEQIALSGNSGKSTGPHLHYEVIVKGNHVNPINYYFMDLDADGYDQMLQMAENHGKIYD
ncbi:MAG: M23 family metallopeptidase [Bacteroidaceae bacterium]|nr:M23 family metallopeptidase [Bacteroidaceae bacterium]